MANKKKVKVTIYMEWLLYDIMNETFLRGRTIQDDKNYKEVASMFASEDEENQEKILRSIKRAYGEVQSALPEYLDEDGTETDNANIKENEELVLPLLMPSNFNEAATKGIGEAVHDYIAKTAIADWYLVTNKEDAADYAKLAERSMKSICMAVSKRSRPKRPVDKRVLAEPSNP